MLQFLLVTLVKHNGDGLTFYHDICIQRSIKDEIERESMSDVTTIVVSYMVMFVYVSVMLGKYSSNLREILVCMPTRW